MPPFGGFTFVVEGGAGTHPRAGPPYPRVDFLICRFAKHAVARSSYPQHVSSAF